jgi:hypothetical protein
MPPELPFDAHDSWENHLGNQCPNCTGNFVMRPTRPEFLLESSPV